MEREENRNLIKQMQEAVTALQEIKEKLLEENKALRARKEHLEKELKAKQDTLKAEIMMRNEELAKRKRNQQD